MPLMVILSTLSAPLTARVIVIVELETETLALVIFAPAVKETLPTPELNRQPLGAVRISVLLEPPVSAISPFPDPVSAMTMLPSVVKAGPAPFCAISAERPVPPVAVVIVTLASALAQRRVRPAVKINGTKILFIRNTGTVVCRSEEHTSELQSRSDLVCR